MILIRNILFVLKEIHTMDLNYKFKLSCFDNEISIPKTLLYDIFKIEKKFKGENRTGFQTQEDLAPPKRLARQVGRGCVAEASRLG